MQQSLETYMKTHHIDIFDEYKRANSLNYWESGVIYNPLRSGFGCSGKSDKQLVLDYASVGKNSLLFTFYEVKDKTQRYCLDIKDAAQSMKRYDENIEYHYNMPNKGGLRYLTVNGIDYTINYMFFRYYENNRLCCRVIIRKVIPDKVFNYGYTAFWELYSQLGRGTFSLSHTHSYDSIGRANSTFIGKLSVKDAKIKIFEKDVKIPLIQKTENLFQDFDKYFKK